MPGEEPEMLAGNPFFSLLWMVVSVIVIIALAYWFTKYVAGRGGLGVFGPLKAGGGLEVLAQRFTDCMFPELAEQASE